MARQIDRLKALTVKRLTVPGYYNDGAGLYLQVAKGGSKSWIFRFKINGRSREMGLGSAVTFDLADARGRCAAARKLVADGIDPILYRDAARSEQLAATARNITFKEAAADYIFAQESGWKSAKHAQQWRATLEKYAYPKIGDMLVSHIQMSHVLDVLRPIWKTKTETASRVRSRIELVLAAGDKIAGIERMNPARWGGNLDTQLAKPGSVAKVVHHEALAVDEIGAFMVDLRQQQGIGARALEFAILTATRSGEVRGAMWEEIDFDGAVWTIAADRMKGKREHRVPLSKVAIDLLRTVLGAAKRDEDGNLPKLVFPAPRGGQFSDMTLSAVMRRMGANAVPHGMRSTFRDWAAERTHYPNEVAEMALAHAVGDKTEAAYRRGDLLQKRVAIMADWAHFLAQPAASKANAISSKKVAA